MVPALPLRCPGKPKYQGDMLGKRFHAVRALLVLAIIGLALAACKTTWQPPPGTGHSDRWDDSYRGR
jgi:hypothetical protein